jgi:hypothetical protein
MIKKKIGSAFSPFSSPFYLYMVRVQTVATPRLTGVSTAPGWQIYTQISMIKEAKLSHAQVLVLLEKINAKTAAISLSPYLDKRRTEGLPTFAPEIVRLRINTEYGVSFISIHTILTVNHTMS